MSFLPLVPGPGTEAGAFAYIAFAAILLWAWAFVRVSDIARAGGFSLRRWRIAAISLGPLAVALISRQRKTSAKASLEDDREDPVT